ncbi:hypothetical protein [Brevundimonas sp.]|jgi:hypothetical protein|uniref:hypothetical protein n=1 Tax=Brevundimonas sp. TaxID=1871086 RepID=UPI00378398E9
MLSLISTLGGLLISGLPKLLEFFQNKADQKHELALARVQTERELQMAAAGFAAQAKIEEIRTEQVAMQTQAQMAEAEAEMVKGAQEHDKAVLAKASTWVVNYVGTVRPTVTYIFVFELVAINAFLCIYLWNHPNLITSIDDVIRYSDLIFSSDEMAMLGGIIGFWFGSRQWSKK